MPAPALARPSTCPVTLTLIVTLTLALSVSQPPKILRHVVWAADSDGDGMLDLNDFCRLMKELNKDRHRKATATGPGAGVSRRNSQK